MLKLQEDEREVLLAEVAQAHDQVRSPEAKRQFGELLAAVDAGEVPDELAEPLQNLLEVGLESGRIRKLHTAHGEMAAQRVFSRTPRARATRETVAAVNEALAALVGHTLNEVSMSAGAPGSYSLTLATDQGKVLVRLDRREARVHSVEVG